MPSNPEGRSGFKALPARVGWVNMLKFHPLEYEYFKSNLFYCYVCNPISVKKYVI